MDKEYIEFMLGDIKQLSIIDYNMLGSDSFGTRFKKSPKNYPNSWNQGKVLNLWINRFPIWHHTGEWASSLEGYSLQTLKQPIIQGLKDFKIKK